VKKGKKTVTKSETVVLASSSYTLAKDTRATVSLVVTARGRVVLQAAKPKSALHETLVATVFGGGTVRKILVIT